VDFSEEDLAGRRQKSFDRDASRGMLGCVVHQERAEARAHLDALVSVFCFGACVSVAVPLAGLQRDHLPPVLVQPVHPKAPLRLEGRRHVCIFHAPPFM
jgi:hypothetical protein